MSEKWPEVYNSLDTQKKQLLQETINNHLLKWVDINNEREYLRFINVLNKSLGIDLSKLTYQSINSWSPFAIKKNTILDNNLTVFSLYSFLNISLNWPFNKLWSIDKNWIFIKDLSRNVNYNTDRSLDVDTILNDLENKINNLKPNQQVTEQSNQEVVEDENYIVKKWDTLWKLVKEKYWLTDNRDIANTINSLVRHNANIKKIKTDIAPPNHIRWDLIIVWKTIILPWELKVLWKTVKKSKG